MINELIHVMKFIVGPQNLCVLSEYESFYKKFKNIGFKVMLRINSDNEVRC